MNTPPTQAPSARSRRRRSSPWWSRPSVQAVSPRSSPVPSRPAGRMRDPRGLLGAVASVRRLGRQCRRPLAAGGTGGHRRIPHGPGGGAGLSTVRQTGSFCPQVTSSGQKTGCANRDFVVWTSGGNANVSSVVGRVKPMSKARDNRELYRILPKQKRPSTRSTGSLALDSHR